MILGRDGALLGFREGAADWDSAEMIDRLGQFAAQSPRPD